MKQKIKGDWVGGSSVQSREERLKAHKEFEASEFKKMLDSGWDITKTEVKHKRPRIKQDGFKVVMIFNKPMKLTLQEYNDHYVIAFNK